MVSSMKTVQEISPGEEGKRKVLETQFPVQCHIGSLGIYQEDPVKRAPIPRGQLTPAADEKTSVL